MPEDYIEAREGDLRRIADIGSDAADKDINRKAGELIRHSVQSREESILDILNIGNLTDLLS